MILALARVELDPAHPVSVRLLGQPYEMHRFVYRIAAGQGTRDRLLYRVEPDPTWDDGRYRILVQRDRAWTGDEEPERGDGYYVERRNAEVTLTSGTYRFRLRANPVKALPASEKGARGKRIGLEAEEAQLNWLSEKLSRGGMRLESVDRYREPWLIFSKGSNQRSRLSFVSALFEGMLHVDDPDDAETAIVNGIGPGKGFGFGLLSLARAAK